MYTSWSLCNGFHWDSSDGNIFLGGALKLTTLRLGGTEIPLCRPALTQLTTLDVSMPGSEDLEC